MSSNMHIRCAPALAAMMAIACRGHIGDSDDRRDVTVGACVDIPPLFEDTLWRPTLSATCLGCHVADGAAKDSAFILVPSEQPDYLGTNLEAFKAVALDRSSGESLVLEKISGGLPHAGGVLAPTGSTTYLSFATVVSGLDNPCPEGSETPGGPYFDDVVLLAEAQTLRKATFELTSRYPTAAELDQVRDQGIDAIDPILDTVMREEGFYVRVKEIFNDVFLTEGLIYPVYGLPEAGDLPNYYGDNYSQFQTAPEEYSELWNVELGKMMTSEPINLVAWVLRNDRPFSEILTADYTVVNPYSARYYGVPLDGFTDPDDPNEWIAATLPDRPQAGVLSTVGFLEKYPTTQTNRNRARSRVVFQVFLATNVLALESEPLPASAVSEPMAWLNNPACTVCHDRVDPLAGCFQDYNDFDDRIGRYRPKPWFSDMRPPGLNGIDAPPDVVASAQTLPWVAEQIVADPRFSMAMAQLMFRGLTGQTPLVEPTDADAPDYAANVRAFEAQRSSLQSAADDYLAEDHDLRALIKSLVKSPWYRAVNANVDDPERLAELRPVGTARVLSPEKLKRRLTATIGHEVFAEIDRVWTGGATGFKLLYGGIDSRGSTVRASAMNAVMAGVAERMANQVACDAAPLEFSQPAGDRVLFPGVEPSDTAETAQAAVIGTMVDLHERFFGERLSDDDPQIVRAFELFRAVQAAGLAGIAAGDESTTLPSACRNGMSEDPSYGVRAWMATLTLLLSDYRFLHD